jgi:hypothetical protein
MAEVRISGSPSLASLEPGYEHQINGLLAGATITPGQFVYIRASDNRVLPATGAAANEAARAVGVVLQGAVTGDGVTILHGLVVRWGAALTAGAPFYLSGVNAGELADAASTGGTTIIARAVDATRIYVCSP